MSMSRLSGIVLTGAFVLCGVGWLMLPVLRTSRQRVDAEATVGVERARRLLVQYEAGIERKSLLLDDLTDLFEQAGRLGVKGEWSVDDAGALDEEAKDEYQQQHAASWEAFQPRDWKSPKPAAARASYTNIEGQIREGMKTRKELLARNAAWLDQALSAVENALKISAGDASARQHGEANRVKGIILHHQAVAQRIEGRGKRVEAAPFLAELADLAAQAASLAPLDRLVQTSEIEVQIGKLNAEAASLEKKLHDLSAEKRTLTDAAAGLERRINEARAKADQARSALDALKSQGIDFSEARPVEAFAERIRRADQAYREALRDIQSLQRGRLPNATIEPSKDFLFGRYRESGSPRELTIEHGLDHYRNELSMLNETIAAHQPALENVRRAVQTLAQTRDAYRAEEQSVSEQMPKIQAKAAKAYEEFSRIASEAEALEEKALERFQKAAEAASLATKDAERWTSEATRRYQELPPTTQGRSAAAARRDDGWIAGYLAAESADARLGRAWVFLDRYRFSQEAARVLGETTKVIPLPEADPAAERAKAQDARKAGVAEITSAMTALADAHRKTGQHWTIAALGAGARYMMVLFGYSSYLSDAVEAYRTAGKGRENAPSARWIAAREAMISKRK